MAEKASDRTYKLANLHAVLAAYSQFRANLESALEEFDASKGRADRTYADSMNMTYHNLGGCLNQSLNTLNRTLDQLHYDTGDAEDDD